jgi:phosphatidate cytidylyltransferase
MSTAGRWADLGPRASSAIVMVAVGFGATWVGGVVFFAFVAVICGAMVWELARMLDPDTPNVALQTGIMTGVVIVMAGFLPLFYVLPFLLAPALTGAAQISREKGLYLLFAWLIALAGYGLGTVRLDLGFDWVLWLVCVVVATDVAGYFAGKSIGGAKLWPRVSPNKTWSGTVAGWVASGAVGAGFAVYGGFGMGLILISVAMSMVAQAGDIAESAIKRKTGVKDSSTLIPGHGGVMDRFDGMLGAAVFVLLAMVVFGFPAGVM